MRLFLVRHPFASLLALLLLTALADHAQAQVTIRERVEVSRQRFVPPSEIGLDSLRAQLGLVVPEGASRVGYLGRPGAGNESVGGSRTAYGTTVAAKQASTTQADTLLTYFVTDGSHLTLNLLWYHYNALDSDGMGNENPPPFPDDAVVVAEVRRAEATPGSPRVTRHVVPMREERFDPSLTNTGAVFYRTDYGDVCAGEDVDYAQWKSVAYSTDWRDFQETAPDSAVVDLGMVADGDTVFVSFRGEGRAIGSRTWDDLYTYNHVYYPDKKRSVNGFWITGDACHAYPDPGQVRGFVQLQEVALDLVADSDHDGDVDIDDEERFFDGDQVGTLVAYNDDDDNGNDVPDYDDPFFAEEDDLEALQIDAQPQGVADFADVVVTLERLSEREGIRIWTDAAKTDSIDAFPYEILHAELPKTYYVEGTDWADAPARFRASMLLPNGDTLADTVQFYAGPLGLGLPDTVEAGSTPLAVLTGLQSETEVTFTAYVGGALVGSHVAVQDGLISSWAVPVPQQAGQQLLVRAEADGGLFELETDSVAVVPGPAAEVAFSVTDDRLPATEFATTDITLTARDAYGNLVADGTYVTWLMDGLGSLLTTTDVTVNGEALATVQSGWTDEEEQGLHVLLDGYEGSTQVEQLDVTVTLSADTDLLTARSSETATITASFVDEDGDPVADGTPVTWYAQKGTITGNPVVTGGQAIATLSAQGPANAAGANVVTASIANNVGTMELPFTEPGGLYVTLDEVVLAGDATTDGTVDVEQVDGSFAAYEYAVQTTGHVRGGPPGATVRIRITDGSVASVPEQVALSDTTFSGHAFVEGQSLVETTGAVIVASGADVTFKASGSEGRVRLGPGFLAEAGAQFRAEAGEGDVPSAKMSPTVIARSMAEAQEAGQMADNPAPVDLLALNGQVGGFIEVTLDANGEATFTLSSTGLFDQYAGEDDLVASLGVAAEVVGGTGASKAGFAGSTSDTARVAVVKRGFWGRMFDVTKRFAWGAFAGEGDGVAALAGDVVISMLPVIGVYTDGRDIVKELARLWPGGDSPDWGVFAFAFLGIASEVPPFKAGLDQAFTAIKLTIKIVRRGGPLRKSIFRGAFAAIGTGLRTGDISWFIEVAPLFGKMVTNSTFQRLADDVLVQSEEGFEALRTMFHRLGGDEAEQALATLAARSDVSDEALQRVTKEFGGAMDAATAQAIKEAGKTDVVAVGIAQGGWGRRAKKSKRTAYESYMHSVKKLGANDPAILHLDEFADIPGSSKFAYDNPKKLKARGSQGELDVARMFKDLGYKIKSFDLSDGTGMDADVLVQLGDEAPIPIQVKTGKNYEGSSKRNQLITQLGGNQAYAAQLGQKHILAIADDLPKDAEAHYRKYAGKDYYDAEVVPFRLRIKDLPEGKWMPPTRLPVRIRPPVQMLD